LATQLLETALLAPALRICLRVYTLDRTTVVYCNNSSLLLRTWQLGLYLHPDRQWVCRIAFAHLSTVDWDMLSIFPNRLVVRSLHETMRILSGSSIHTMV